MQEQPRNMIVNEASLGQYLTKVYGYMSLGVAVSALVSFLALTIYRVQFVTLIGNNPIMLYALIFLELAFVMGTSFKASRGGALSFVLFMGFAVINGLTLALTLSFYSVANITTAFVAATGTFGAMALYGSLTKRNLAGIGQMAFAALIGLLVATLVNLFLRNPMVDYIFSFIGVIIFIGLTAWDSQRIKMMYVQNAGRADLNGLAIMGALQLYLDFVNLFLFFLRIFGIGGSSND
ncbi:Bax inhibitor-1/YccA family protein [Loigolactobacillus coryniformis]|uniref:Bax inhibitor-1/YccA family protein n=1 Tax=Loigolactobacillus coryniformis TaxID=1610 RepID=UPI0023413C90|nr:Bax inhibitor-1/YccA family protein [Loigolactobacillus coryniformis]MDC4185093.1 Bax inhibitor-1/YccA family protein [Loigolactobacillus coryniformis]